MNSGSDLLARITFGRFCIVPHRREFLSNDRPIMLGGRASTECKGAAFW